MNDPGAWIGLEVECPKGWLDANLNDPTLPVDDVAREWLDERGGIFEEEISIEAPDRDTGLATLRASGFTIADEEIRRERTSEGGRRFHFITPGLLEDATARGVLEHWRNDDAFTIQLDELAEDEVRIEAEGADYDAWELTVEVILCIAGVVRAAGGKMRGVALGGGDAAWHGAGFVGVLVDEEGMETMIEDELQDFDPDASARFFPDGELPD